MSVVVDNLLPDAIKKLTPYQSARRIGIQGHLYLNANELEHTIAFEGSTEPYNRYPDFKPQQVADAYLRYCDSQADCLAVRGADEGIDLIVRTFCGPGSDAILVCPPTYGMYEICATAANVGVRRVPLTAEFQLDLQGIDAELDNTKVIFLCAPNNPTGNAIELASIRRVLEQTRRTHVVVVDEAYIEFSDQPSVVALLDEFDHLMVIRTLSKAFGLAAIRCGFVLGQVEAIDCLRKLIAPYPMPDPTSDIALKALSANSIQMVRDSVADQKQLKAWFCSELEKLPVVERIFPSDTNFVLVRFKDGVNAFEQLVQNGIVARDQSHEAVLDQCVRITMGSQQSMAEILSVLNKKQTREFQ
ncbi:histidinol-phosphate transaminase [Marinobacter salinisoli]|uniref:Histidinol-phosphate aminotransferase n=1 Tax=Marinobacter salinisoli TaxID=2769486 RepID=A0ABX7MTW8_9GAMM|nr:histidinol-phosphate transaminase [Marinobacter salinisoli]QSP95761.1 histidinol-phosphate transaminase [Marinobacter salinisoli]